MKGLIYRDFIILRPSLKTLGLSLIAILAVFLYMNQGSILIMCFPIMFCFMAIGNFQVDAASHWGKASHVMPLSNQDIVMSRYLTLVILYLIGIAISLLFGFGYYSWKQVNDIVYEVFLAVGIGMGLPLFYTAIFYPCAYYFKGERIEQAMVVCMLIMFAFFGGGGVLLKAISIDFLETQLPLYIIVFFVISLIMFIGSFFISNYIFKKGGNS